MGNKFIRTYEHGRYAQVTLARSPLNILNIAMIAEINHYITSLLPRSDLCALLIDAEGAAFSAGVDVPEHRSETVAQMIETFHRTIRLVHKLPMPVVAAVHGGTYGGGMELAVFCDIVLAADDLQIGVPEIALGVYPPVAVALLAEVTGYRHAAELILTGRTINADTANRIGIVSHVYPVSQFRDSVTAYMNNLTRLSAFSLGITRRALRAASFPHFEEALHASEAMYLNDLMTGVDPLEGLQAFMQRRIPDWKDR